MQRIFISYSRKDEAFARKLAEALTQIEADVWLDVEDISAGMKWSSAIQEALDNAQVMLVIVSPDSMASPNVEDEWQYALDHGTPVIPLLWRPANIHFQLNRLQYIDFHDQDFNKAMPVLLREIEMKIESPGSTFVAPKGRQAWPVFTGQYPKWMRYGYLAISAAALLIAGVLIYANLGGLRGQLPNTVGARELTLPGLDSVQVYTSPVRNSETATLEDPIFTLRLVSGNDLWYSVKSASSSATGAAYVPAAELENDELLYSLPLGENLPGNSVQYYERPDFNAPSVTELGAATYAYLYGFWLSEEGDVWYRASKPNGSMAGWLYDADGRFLDYLAAYIQASKPIPSYTEPVSSGATQSTAQGTIMHVLDATTTQYRVLILLDNQWQLRYVERDALVLPDAMQEILESRAIA